MARGSVRQVDPKGTLKFLTLMGYQLLMHNPPFDAKSFPTNDHQNLFYAIVHSLTDSLAVIDQSGDIRFVNRSWEEFGRCNGAVGKFDNYLSVCETEQALNDESSRQALIGLRALLQGTTKSFSLEYPCHSPTVQRWFIQDARRLEWPGEPLFLVTHKDITRRKLAEQAARELSLTDELTGLANRRHFDSFLNREWHALSRSQGQLSLIMFDIDYFKKHNDTFGHQAGDECLKSIAKILQQFGKRQGDLAARYGGEEFVLILGEADEFSAFKIADQIRKQISCLKIPLSHDGEFVSISAGVATVRPTREKCVDQFLCLADQALYLAKSRGRNRVERATEVQKSPMA